MPLAYLKTCTAIAASLLAVQALTTAAIETVPIPAIDFSALANNDAARIDTLVQALEQVGIVSIRNIPGFKEARAKYLDTATACADSATRTSANSGLSYKTLKDGTSRWTVSTKSRDPKSKVTDVCPAYLPSLNAFSKVVDTAAIAFLKGLDSKSESIEKTDTLEALYSKADNLDHFHSYSSPAQAQTADDEDDEKLSLELHVDNGVMIFMTAPEFYALDATRHKPPIKIPREAIVAGPDASAGLVLQVPGATDLVQPRLRDDELIVMIGSGYEAWLSGKGHRVQLPAVLHGMQMPLFSPEFGRVARSWFGRMFLLPKDTMMKNTGMTFGSYAKKVTEYVIGAMEPRAFSTAACPPAMALTASDASCTLRVYAPKRGSNATKEQCMNWCNTHEQVICRAKCDLVATLPHAGIDCWMLCLPKDGVCPRGQVAKCSPDGEQQTVCVNQTMPALRL